MPCCSVELLHCCSVELLLQCRTNCCSVTTYVQALDFLTHNVWTTCLARKRGVSLYAFNLEEDSHGFFRRGEIPLYSPVRHTGLEPQPSRTHTDLHLTRASLALDRPRMRAARISRSSMAWRGPWPA